MNVLLLWSEQVSRGFSSSMWMTFKQALELGGAVRKGETGSTVVFASRFTKSVADGNGNDVDREIPFLKAYSVFNIEQIDGLPDSYYAPPAPVSGSCRADRAAPISSSATPARRSGTAATRPTTRRSWIYIQMPPFETFRDAAGYYGVLSHEATHWTAANYIASDVTCRATPRTGRSALVKNSSPSSAVASSAPISASHLSSSRGPITRPICSPGYRFLPTTSGRSSRRLLMRSAR
jgi:antirestriction protein ArdC